MSGWNRTFDVRELENRLRGESWIDRLIVLDSVDSTNDRLRELARQGAAPGTVILAQRQTAGHGRMGRTWHSPSGLGLYLSVLFQPHGPLDRSTRWTLAAAVAACEACRLTSGAAVEIKWPNDLVWNGRKLGGVLAEMRTATDAAAQLVVGTGLNVSHAPADFPDELSCLATSLHLASGGTAPTRERLAAEYLRALGRAARELQDGSWQAVAQRWGRLAPGAFGQRVRVADAARRGPCYEGLTDGLDSFGALRVLRADGRVELLRRSESVSPMEG